MKCKEEYLSSGVEGKQLRGLVLTFRETEQLWFVLQSFLLQSH